MTIHPTAGPLAIAVIALSAYSVAKFLFFFVLPYAKRRAAVDKQYAGRPAPSATADSVLLIVAGALGFALLLSGSDPIAFLGGMFVGATAIQLFFHAFRADPARGREAPEPTSPLKRMSYAIQDRPSRALREMALMTVLIVTGAVIFFIRP